MEAGNFVAGMVLVLFLGFIAYKMGYLNFQKPEKNTSTGSGTRSGGGSNKSGDIHYK
jgi:hypothetical protein